MPQNTSESKNRLFVSGAVVAAVLVIIAAVASFSKQNSNDTDQNAEDSSASAVSSATPVVTNDPLSSDDPDEEGEQFTYKDGTYSATGSYSTPGGTESVQVSLTVANDAVVSSTVTGSGGTSDAKQYQSLFINNYKQYVTGKDLSQIILSRVSGSSLTSGGFNDALDSIKEQAKI